VVFPEVHRLSNVPFLAAASVAVLSSLPFVALSATSGAPLEAPTDTAEFSLSSAELEAFRQDVEHLQQNFYQASPEMRRRWIESVRERRQRLDLQEDQTAMSQSRMRASRASAPELPRSTVIRAQGRERAID
jgi:hypothetical protein